MPTDLQNSSNFERMISLLTVLTVTVGIGLAAYDVGTGSRQMPVSAEENAGRTPVVAPALPAAPTTEATPHFERSDDEFAIEMDTLNAYGG